MDKESSRMDGKADVSNSHDSCAVEDGSDDALHVVGLLLDSVLSGVVTKRTATTEKKKTVKFTSEQKERMERAFSEEKFIKGAKLANLAQEVGLTKEQGGHAQAGTGIKEEEEPHY